MGGSIPFFRTSDVGRVHLGELADAEDRLNEVGAKGMRLHPAGTVLMPKSGASTFTDHRVITTTPGYVSSHLATIKANGKTAVDRYLYYALQTISARAVAGDSSYPTLSLAQLKAIRVPAAPLHEQLHIVAILDGAYAAIEVANHAATASLAASNDLLKTGVSALLASPGANLREATLGELCEIYQPKTISTADMDEAAEYPVFGANGQIGRYQAYNHEEPQLLVTCRGATCGRINVSLPQSWITGNAMVVRPRTPELSLRFLRRLLEYGFDFRPVITGSAQPQITRQSLAPSLIAFPPQIEEQERLADAIEELVAATRTYQALLDRRLALLAELKQSLLARAFAGELTRESRAA